MANALPGNDCRTNDFHLRDRETRIIDSELLLQRAFDQDPREGCTLLFRVYYAALCSHAIRFVYSKEVAEDIVGEVFCRFWEDQIFLKINVSYGAYLAKAVRHKAYNYVKLQLSRKVPDEKFEENQASSDPDKILQYDELYNFLVESINALPQQCKKVFVLSRMENKRYQDIAAELEISVKSIEAHISRALRILRKKMNRHWSWE